LEKVTQHNAQYDADNIHEIVMYRIFFHLYWKKPTVKALIYCFLKNKEVKLPCVTQNGMLTVASFRTWRGWAMFSCTGLDPNNTKTPKSVNISLSTAGKD